MRKAYKYRLYPNKTTEKQLQWVLDRCREVYNAALQERRDTWKNIKQHPNYYDLEWRKQSAQEHGVSFSSQSAQLPDIKDIREEYRDIYAQVLQDVLRRLDKAFQRFFCWVWVLLQVLLLLMYPFMEQFRVWYF